MKEKAEAQKIFGQSDQPDFSCAKANRHRMKIDGKFICSRVRYHAGAFNKLKKGQE